jgi:soluble lytic murein transglycosylase-like protein
MSTIFNTSYSESLRRIHGERRDVQTDKEAKPQTFAEILSRNEKQNQPPADARAALITESHPPTPSQGVVSNLTTSEALRIEEHAPAHEAYRLTTKELLIESPNVSGTIAKLAPRVSAISPQPSLPISQGSAPKAPAMVSAKRVDQPLLALEPVKITPPKLSKTNYEETLEGIITKAGKHHGVDPALSIAVARAESSLRVDAVSKDGHASKGMFQLLDVTGRELMNRLDVDGHYTPFEPTQNAHLGVGYLRRLHDLFSKESNLGFNLRTNPVNSASDLEKVAVAAFNAGEGNVARAQKIAKSLGKDPGSYDAIEPHLPASTRAYVERVGALKARAVELTDEETLA